MSTTDLQWLAQIPEKTIRRWADGVHEPKLSSIAPLCRGLKIDANWLVGLTDEIEPGVLYPWPEPNGAINALEELDAPRPSDGNSASEQSPTRSRARRKKPPSA